MRWPPECALKLCDSSPCSSLCRFHSSSFRSHRLLLPPRPCAAAASHRTSRAASAPHLSKLAKSRPEVRLEATRAVDTSYAAEDIATRHRSEWRDTTSRAHRWRHHHWESCSTSRPQSEVPWSRCWPECRTHPSSRSCPVNWCMVKQRKMFSYRQLFCGQTKWSSSDVLLRFLILSDNRQKSFLKFIRDVDLENMKPIKLVNTAFNENFFR